MKILNKPVSDYDIVNKKYVDEDISGKANNNNPETTGVFYHKGNGTGDQTVVLKVQSNNGVLTGHGDASSAFHLGGVPVAMDTTLFINNGITFPTFGQTLEFNGATVRLAAIEAREGTCGRITTGCDFNGFPTAQQENFVVFNRNVSGGRNDNWSFQSYYYDTEQADYVRNFGVKADGTIITKGEEVATKNDITTPAATSTTIGGIKVRYDSSTSTLYIRNDGSDA